MINKKVLLPVPTPNVEKKLTLILIFTLLYGASKGFMTVLKIIELENVKEPTQKRQNVGQINCYFKFTSIQIILVWNIFIKLRFWCSHSWGFYWLKIKKILYSWCKVKLCTKISQHQIKEILLCGKLDDVPCLTECFLPNMVSEI